MRAARTDAQQKSAANSFLQTVGSLARAWETVYAKQELRSAWGLGVAGLAHLIVGDVQPWGALMAASLLTAVPVVVIYMLGQRFMVAGLTAGSVKG